MASPDWLFNSNPMVYQALQGLFGDRWDPVKEAVGSGAFDMQGGQAGMGPGPIMAPYGQPPQAPQAPQAMAFNQPQPAPSFPALPQMRNTSQPGDANFYGGSPEGNRNLQPFGAPPPQMAAGAMAQAPTMPPTGQSPGAMDRFSAGLQGAGSSFMNGGGPIGALVNLIGGLAEGKRTDPAGVQQEEMLKQYQSLQKDFGLSPAQARMMLVNKEFGKEAAKPIANPELVTMPDGTMIKKNAFGKWEAVGAAPKPEQKDFYDEATGRMRSGFITPPSSVNPNSAITISGRGIPGQTGAGGGIYTQPSAAEKKTQEVTGEGTGKAIVGLPVAIEKSAFLLDTINKTLAHPGLPIGTGLTGVAARQIPGTKGYDFGALHNQVKGKAFLEAFESLKGAGQITEVEGAKATDAIARLDAAQSEKAYREALEDLRDVTKSGYRRSLLQAGKSPAEVENILKSVGPEKPAAEVKTGQPVKITPSMKPADVKKLYPSGTPIILPDGTMGKVP